MGRLVTVKLQRKKKIGQILLIFPVLGKTTHMSPKNEYFCTTPKNGSAQECGSKGGPHGNISARKSNITARIQNKALFLHGEITNLPLIIQCIDFVPFPISLQLGILVESGLPM